MHTSGTARCFSPGMHAERGCPQWVWLCNGAIVLQWSFQIVLYKYTPCSHACRNADTLVILNIERSGVEINGAFHRLANEVMDIHIDSTCTCHGSSAVQEGVLFPLFCVLMMESP